LESPKEFIQYLEDNNLYNRLAKIMKSEKNMFLYNGKNVNKRIKQIICTSFKQFIYYSDKNTREKLKKLIVENINIYELIEFELNDESKKKVKNNLKSLLILLFIKKKINEKNFINELENNFSVYLDIDETIEKLNEIKGNIDIFEDKEIGNNIKKHIKDLLILNYKIIETTNIKTKIKKDYDKCDDSNNNIYSRFGNMMYSIYLLNPFNHFDNFFVNYINNNDFCFIEGSSLFAKLIKMKIDNIKLLFLYCKESLKKIINKKKNNFSLIELMFNEISLNDNIDKNCEWYNFINEKQKYDKKSKKKLFNYIQFISEYKYFLKCFHKLIRLNEALLLRNRKFMNYMIIPELSKYIIEFSKLINYKLLPRDYNEVLYQYKLREIYTTLDIALLTFYELVLLEIKNKIKYGFLSILETQFLYDFTMKDLKKYEKKQVPKLNRIYKKEKRLNKKLDNRISKFKANKKDAFEIMNLSLWKTRAPIKIKKINNKQNKNKNY